MKLHEMLEQAALGAVRAAALAWIAFMIACALVIGIALLAFLSIIGEAFGESGDALTFLSNLHGMIPT